MNKKLISILLLIFLLSTPLIFAEIIVLKSGKTVEEKILEKTDESIKVDIEGIPITYYIDEVESIDGQKASTWSAEAIGDKKQQLSSSQNGQKLSGPDDMLSEGIAYTGKQNPDEAIAEFTKASRVNPNDAEVYSNRGDVYFYKANYDQAILDYNRVIEINPNSARAYNYRGIAYYRKGDYEQAISNYRRAIEIDPNFSRAYYSRAIAYYWEKEYDKAWTDVHKAQELGYEVPPRFIEELKKVT